jgi:ribosome biogenesis GTPase A
LINNLNVKSNRNDISNLVGTKVDFVSDNNNTNNNENENAKKVHGKNRKNKKITVEIVSNNLLVDSEPSSSSLNAVDSIEKNVNYENVINDNIDSTKISIEDSINIDTQVDNINFKAKTSSQDTSSSTICICQRCYRLQQYGQIDENLRPGWSNHDFLTPERFETLLGSIKTTTSVVLCIIDIFDIKGSLLKNLKQIIGKNPIVIAVNKIDLFPKDISQERIINWIYAEIKEFCELKTPKDLEEEKKSFHSNNKNLNPYSRSSTSFSLPRLDDEKTKKPVDDNNKDVVVEESVLRRSNIHLVSCQSGFGMDKLMTNIVDLAKENGNKVFVMGAANVGKSSFINRLLEKNYNTVSNKNNNENNDDKSFKNKQYNKFSKQKTNSFAQATVSNLPGTTLDFLKIKLANGITMIDTPGLLNKVLLFLILFMF